MPSAFVEATDVSNENEIPLIDLTNFDSPEGRVRMAAEIRGACTSIGFFILTGHGIPLRIMEDLFASSQRYFSLPLSEKASDACDPDARRGFLGAAGSMPRETYDLGIDLPDDDPDVQAGHFMHGANRWPANYPWLKDAIEPYLDCAQQLARKLEILFAIGLGLHEDYFVELCRKPMLHMRLFHYLPQTEEQRLRELAAPAHTDLGMFTILLADPQGGLEVQRRDGMWIKVPFVEGALVVNLGDMLEIWTNDTYVSTPHRVVAVEANRHRHSVPIFIAPAYDTIVKCLDSCVSPGEAPKHGSFHTGQYLSERLSVEYILRDGSLPEAVGSHRIRPT